MKVLKKNIIKATAAALALCVAGTALYINTNTAPVIKEYKLPDYFELTEQSTIGFNGAYFIELAYLSGTEEFLDYTDIDDTDNGDADESESDNSDNSELDGESNRETDISGGDDIYDAADYNDDNEQSGVPDEEYTDTDITDNDYEQTDEGTTLPPEYENTNEDMFIVNEFDMLTKYNGTDETVVIPENVKEIAGHAFEGNEYVRRIVLHTTIDSLNLDAFIGCPNLCEIYYEGTSEEWDIVYKAPDVIPYGVEVVIAQETDTTAETTAPVEETTEDTTAETTAPVDETSEDTTAETTAPAEEILEDTTAETTAPIEESTEDTTAETTAPVEETTVDTTAKTTASVEETTEDTAAPVEETTEDTTTETTAPVEETTEDTTAETTAPVEEATEDTIAETIAPVEETTEDTTAETTTPVEETTVDTTAETTAPVEETTEDTTAETTAPVEENTEDTTAETTAPVEETTEDTTAPVEETTEDTTAETTASVEETTEDTTAETTAPVEETADNTEDTTQPSEVKESKTVSLVSQLAGINGVKTKIAARMSYFPTSSVITVTNTDAAALYAKEALQLLDSDVISYYAFDISVFDADTSKKIHELGGDLKFDIGVPDILADYGNIKVYHINSGYPELLDSEIVTNSEGARMVEFSASSFSPFVFAAEEDSAAVTTADETTEPEKTTAAEAAEENTVAAEEPSDEESTEDTTSTHEDDEPIIKVTFPASTSYIINPYHLDVKVSDDVTSNAAIISPEMKITSESNCKVAVYMSAVAQNVPETVRLSETDLIKSETQKSLFLYVEAADDNNAYKNYYDGSANQIVVSQNGGQSQKILELEKPEEGSYTEGKFKIFGETFMPNNDLWRDNENVSILMVFRVEAVQAKV